MLRIPMMKFSEANTGSVRGVTPTSNICDGVWKLGMTQTQIHKIGNNQMNNLEVKSSLK